MGRKPPNRTGISPVTTRTVVSSPVSCCPAGLVTRFSLVAYTTRLGKPYAGERVVLCCMHREAQTGASRTQKPEARDEEGDVNGAIAPTRPLTALDLCDRCGAQAYVRVLLPNSGELLFCAHHGREHAEALAKVAVDIQDETQRLTNPEN
jgi:hypothetical protein